MVKAVQTTPASGEPEAVDCEADVDQTTTSEETQLGLTSADRRTEASTNGTPTTEWRSVCS